ncbi:MAG: hypothetical protein QOI11_3757 [Candidatus Eremiobacteraeota bacterium]|nr:hypothetical protein [Candidatus Eremiobacteraeota bacterium]
MRKDTRVLHAIWIPAIVPTALLPQRPRHAGPRSGAHRTKPLTDRDWRSHRPSTGMMVPVPQLRVDSETLPLRYRRARIAIRPFEGYAYARRMASRAKTGRLRTFVMTASRENLSLLKNERIARGWRFAKRFSQREMCLGHDICYTLHGQNGTNRGRRSRVREQSHNMRAARRLELKEYRPEPLGFSALARRLHHIGAGSKGRELCNSRFRREWMGVPYERRRMFRQGAQYRGTHRRRERPQSRRASSRYKPR